MILARYLVPLLGMMLSGCAALDAVKLLTPESHGLEKVTPSLYVEAGADAQTRQRLQEAMVLAERAIEAAYGSVQTRPTIHACVTDVCSRNLGNYGAVRAKVFNVGHGLGHLVLLSPRGLNWHYIAHEWSHAEVISRLSFTAWLKLPQWFDEGLAVAISEAPETSEAHWQLLVATNVARPTRDELLTFGSLRQWDQAVGRYGEKQNLERKARGEPGITPVYSAAGHEVRPWLRTVGKDGLLRLIADLNARADFEVAYKQAISAAAW